MVSFLANFECLLPKCDSIKDRRVWAENTRRIVAYRPIQPIYTALFIAALEASLVSIPQEAPELFHCKMRTYSKMRQQARHTSAVRCVSFCNFEKISARHS